MTNSVTFSAPSGSAIITQTGPDSARVTEQMGTSAPSTHALSGITVGVGTVMARGPFGSKILLTITPLKVHVIVTEWFFTAMDKIIPITAEQYAETQQFLAAAKFPEAA